VERERLRQQHEEEIHIEILEADDKMRLALAPLNETEDSSFEGEFLSGPTSSNAFINM
jgi:hypothetical protein